MNTFDTDSDIQKRWIVSSLTSMLALVAFVIVVVVFYFVATMVQKKNDEIAELKDTIAKQKVSLLQYEEQVYDAKRELEDMNDTMDSYRVLLAERNSLIIDLRDATTQEIQSGSNASFPDLQSYFIGIDFSDGMDETELYEYNKMFYTAKYMNILEMVEKQLRIDNQLLEQFSNASDKIDSSNKKLFDIYVEELNSEIAMLNDKKAECLKNLDDLANYESAVPKP